MQYLLLGFELITLVYLIYLGLLVKMRLSKIEKFIDMRAQRKARKIFEQKVRSELSLQNDLLKQVEVIKERVANAKRKCS